MNKKVLKTLEFHKIIETLTEKAGSEPGKALCRELVPMTSLSDITLAQKQTSDALSMLFPRVPLPLAGIRMFPIPCDPWRSAAPCLPPSC